MRFHRLVVSSRNIKDICWRKFILNSKKLCFIDFETTGTDPSGVRGKQDRITEIAAVIIKNGEIFPYQAYCNPGRKISKEVEQITGVTNEMVCDKPSPEEVMLNFRKFLHTHYAPFKYNNPGNNLRFVAHNAAFDAHFMSSECHRAKIRNLNNSFICSLVLAKHFFPEAKSYKLQPLAEYLGFNLVKGETAHRALVDVKMLIYVWNCLEREIIQNHTKPLYFSHKTQLKIRNPANELIEQIDVIRIEETPFRIKPG